MDKYDYVIAKPEMEEVLYHAGFHKYIDKYLGKNGKWIYKYAGQAKNAATGAINKAKTMLPGLQKQATGAVSTARKAVSTAASSGARTASSVKKQAQKRINAMLPILSKKFNSAKKKARSQAAGVKLVAKSKTNKLKKQADGTMKNISTTAKRKAKGTYYSGKSKMAEAKAKAARGAMPVNGVTKDIKKQRADQKKNGGGINFTMDFDAGKANSRSGQTGAKKVRKTTKVTPRSSQFVTKRRNSKAAATARKNRRAK